MLFKTPEVKQFTYMVVKCSQNQTLAFHEKKNTYLCTLHRTVQSYPVSRHKELVDGLIHLLAQLTLYLKKESVNLVELPL